MKKVECVTAFARLRPAGLRFFALTLPDLTGLAEVEAGTTRTEFVTAASFPT